MTSVNSLRDTPMRIRKSLSSLASNAASCSMSPISSRVASVPIATLMSIDWRSPVRVNIWTMNSPPGSTMRGWPPMKTKLHALKHAQPAGMRVTNPKFERITRPAALPARASPPGERSQTSLTSGLAASAAFSRSGSPASIRPSASSTLPPFFATGVSFIIVLADQSGVSGQVGLAGSIAGVAAPVRQASSPAAAAARTSLCGKDIARLPRPLAHSFRYARFFALDDDDVGDVHALGSVGQFVLRCDRRRPADIGARSAGPICGGADLFPTRRLFGCGRGLHLFGRVEAAGDRIGERPAHFTDRNIGIDAGLARRVADRVVDDIAQDVAADAVALLALGTAAIIVLARFRCRGRHLAKQASELGLCRCHREQAGRHDGRSSQ